MNVQPNYPPCFVSRQPQKAVSENNPVTHSLQTIIVEPYAGSNGYRVGIYTSDSYPGFMAEVIAPEGQQQRVPPSKIVNGLTGQSLDQGAIFEIMQRPSDSFSAVFLAETGKVYLWPHIQAAAQGHDRTAYLVIDNKNNSFLNKSVGQCVADITSGQFTVPGTDYAINFDENVGHI